MKNSNDSAHASIVWRRHVFQTYLHRTSSESHLLALIPRLRSPKYLLLALNSSDLGRTIARASVTQTDIHHGRRNCRNRIGIALSHTSNIPSNAHQLQLEQNLNKTRQISQRMTCASSSRMSFVMHTYLTSYPRQL